MNCWLMAYMLWVCVGILNCIYNPTKKLLTYMISTSIKESRVLVTMDMLKYHFLTHFVTEFNFKLHASVGTELISVNGLMITSTHD